MKIVLYSLYGFSYCGAGLASGASRNCVKNTFFNTLHPLTRRQFQVAGGWAEVDNFHSHWLSAALRSVCCLKKFIFYFLYRPEPLCIVLRWSIKTCVTDARPLVCHGLDLVSLPQSLLRLVCESVCQCQCVRAVCAHVLTCLIYLIHYRSLFKWEWTDIYPRLSRAGAAENKYEKVKGQAQAKSKRGHRKWFLELSPCIIAGCFRKTSAFARRNNFYIGWWIHPDI